MPIKAKKTYSVPAPAEKCIDIPHFQTKKPHVAQL